MSNIGAAINIAIVCVNNSGSGSTAHIDEAAQQKQKRQRTFEQERKEERKKMNAPVPFVIGSNLASSKSVIAHISSMMIPG